MKYGTRGLLLLLVLLAALITACGDGGDSYLDGMDTRFALGNELNACKTMHNRSVEGFDIGKYRVGAKGLFLTAINDADTVYQNKATTAAQINSALTALYAAKDVFISKRYDMYGSLVDKSKNTYDTAVEAAIPAEGEFDIGAKAAFISEWNTYAESVTNETVVHADRIAAWSSLREAYVSFLSKQRMTSVKISVVSCNPSDKLTGDNTYVPAGTYRYIELYNNNTVDIDITGWSIQSTKYTFNPDGSAGGEIKKRNFDAQSTSVIIKAKSYLLISKDNVWSAGIDPDFIIEDIDFMMGDGGRGITVVRANDVLVSNYSPLIVDAVGYSNAAPAAGFYEGKTITNSTMIIRKWQSSDTLLDTGENSTDFYNISTNTAIWRLPRNSQWIGDCTWTW